MSDIGSDHDEAARALTGLVRALADLPPAGDDAVRIDRIRLLEELKSAAAAAQARETAEFAASQRAEQRALGVPEERVGCGIAAQVALAKRVSPFHAQRYAGWASILTSELPATFAELQAGRTSEWRAMVVARETAWLSREDRVLVDAELGPKLETLGDRKVEAEAKRLAYRLDPHGYVDRVRGADGDRRVTLRPAPEVMARLTGFLPVAQGVAAHAALTRDADALIAAGDPRTRGQVMADLMVERLTGQAQAKLVPVEVEVVLDADTLLGNTDQPADLQGYGPIPADTARDLIRAADRAWLRRLFTRPDTGQLIAMETHRRLFTDGQRRFVRLRDQTCRTPWCDAPIRHTDHVTPADDGGPTKITNAQALCQACNHAKQAPGWTHRSARHGTETIITTPTGHRYPSRAPDPPGRRHESPLERQLRALIAAA